MYWFLKLLLLLLLLGLLGVIAMAFLFGDALEVYVGKGSPKDAWCTVGNSTKNPTKNSTISPNRIPKDTDDDNETSPALFHKAKDCLAAFFE